MYLKPDLLHDVFWVYLANSTDDSCCNTVFILLSAVVSLSITYFHSLISTT